MFYFGGTLEELKNKLHLDILENLNLLLIYT